MNVKGRLDDMLNFRIAAVCSWESSQKRTVFASSTIFRRQCNVRRPVALCPLRAGVSKSPLSNTWVQNWEQNFQQGPPPKVRKSEPEFEFGNAESHNEVLAGCSSAGPEDEGLRIHTLAPESSRWKRGRRVAMFLGATSFWTSVGCRHCDAAGAQVDWTYGGPYGPSDWQGLCTSGPAQSPLNITLSKIEGGESLGELDFAYAPSSPSIFNTGHGTMQVSFPNSKNVLNVGGKTLQLLQFHFHAPSEHAFDGKRSAMEAHLVHRDLATKKLAVVGIMLNASKDAAPNKCLEASLAYAPPEHGHSADAPIQLSPSSLIPAPGKNGSRGYVHYRGSLTTPPCSEGVEWFVLDTSLEISSSQALDFMRFAGDGYTLAFNSRPLQAFGDRVVFQGP